MRLKTLAAILPLALPLAAAPAAAADMEREDIERIVREYILEHPEVLVEAMDVLEQRQRAAAEVRARESLDRNYDLLVAAPGDPVAGNPDGDVTIVEFFDYRCPYCRRIVEPLMETVESDGNIRLVFKEFPILGPESTTAAQAALASAMQGRYVEFHEALMNAPALDEAAIMSIAEDVGLDTDRLRKDMESEAVAAHIAVTHRLAQELGIRGTPALVIGRQLIPGAIGIDEMKRYVEEARRRQS